MIGMTIPPKCVLYTLQVCTYHHVRQATCRSKCCLWSYWSCLIRFGPQR